MRIKFDDDFLKNHYFNDGFLKEQYKKLASAYRAKNIALMACYFRNIELVYGGVFTTELSQFIEKAEKQKQIDFAYESTFNGDMGSLSYFLHKSMSKNRLSLFLAIDRNNKKIRKQEEAPTAKASGAESSLELCGSCKNTFKNDHDVCPDCALMGGV